MSDRSPTWRHGPSEDGRPLVIFVDWSSGGHNATHLAGFCRAAAACGAEAAIVCLHGLAAQLREGEGHSADPPGVTIVSFAFPPVLPLRPRSLQLHLQRRALQSHVVDSIKAVERQCRKTASLVFFSCIFEEHLGDLHSVVSRLPRSYSGLYLHPRQMHPATARADREKPLDTLFRHPRFRAIATMNEDVTERMAARFGKACIPFPEITDESHDPDHPFRQRLRRFAGASPLVVLAGYLGPWKGASLLAEICLRPEAADLAFAFVGTLTLDVFPPAQRRIMERCMNESPNAFFHIGRVPDGKCYNAALDAADAVFCMFDNFPFSSNTLTKAAVLEKPVVVSEGGLMARRVSQYGLGEVVKEGDLSGALAALRRITAEPRQWIGQRQPQWSAYRRIHSAEALERAFGELLSAVGVPQLPAVS